VSLPAGALEQAVIVAAHPSDEFFWLGSIVKRVQRIVIVFADNPDQPELAAARRVALPAHPLADCIELLSLTEIGTFDSMDWERPEFTAQAPR
jgi:hypothetical protein